MSQRRKKKKTKKSGGAPPGFGQILSSAEASNKKNLMKIMALQKILQKHNLPGNVPVEQTQYSYAQPQQGKLVVRKYKKKTPGRPKKKRTIHVQVDKEQGKHKYQVSLQ
jgi:hypothetical protein